MKPVWEQCHVDVTYQPTQRLLLNYAVGQAGVYDYKGPDYNLGVLCYSGHGLANSKVYGYLRVKYAVELVDRTSDLPNLTPPAPLDLQALLGLQAQPAQQGQRGTQAHPGHQAPRGLRVPEGLLALLDQQERKDLPDQQETSVHQALKACLEWLAHRARLAPKESSDPQAPQEAQDHQESQAQRDHSDQLGYLDPPSLE